MTHSQLTKREYLNSRQEVREGREREREGAQCALSSLGALFHFNEYCIAKRRAATHPAKSETGQKQMANIIFLQLGALRPKA